MLFLIALAACGAGATWLDGVWEMTSWTVTVGDPAAPTFRTTLPESGRITFSGSGEWWESDLFYEGPNLVQVEPGVYGVIDQSAWTYWALQNREIWLAWGQNYANPEVLVPDTPRASTFRATSSGELSEVDAVVPVTTEWTLTREAP
jgi:hypothetical protein